MALSEAERDRMTRDLLELVAALADPSRARTVKVRGRDRIATDGPYLEAKEHMAGLFIIDCATRERAEEVAARFPEARFSAVELRPVEG